MLVVDSVTKRYGETLALDSCSFRVEPGRIVGFLGPNGAGKTTAMRSILGLIRPDGGTVTWEGRPLDHHVRLRFGYMPEERGLYPKMKVGEQLAYFARLSGVEARSALAAVDQWLERLSLSDRAGSKLEDLSHGNQQRVQLAAALIHTPALAVLDEPFSGLDPIGVDTMAAILRELAAAGVGILFSSHQLDLVEDICEDVVIVNRGKVVVAGRVEELRLRSPLRHLEVSVDGVRWAGLTESDGLVDSGIDLVGLIERARAEGEVTRLVFEPPRLGELFLAAVTE
ncbi:MAG TPA: ATP-binding cassette domain-containing protein [Acidimicrobiia bacterium]|nr:ATP-binding cassette domain-containing protein [Acidimicrobiia bacterium]